MQGTLIDCGLFGSSLGSCSSITAADVKPIKQGIRVAGGRRQAIFKAVERRVLGPQQAADRRVRLPPGRPALRSRPSSFSSVRPREVSPSTLVPPGRWLPYSVKLPFVPGTATGGTTKSMYGPVVDEQAVEVVVAAAIEEIVQLDDVFAVGRRGERQQRIMAIRVAVERPIRVRSCRRSRACRPGANRCARPSSRSRLARLSSARS